MNGQPNSVKRAHINAKDTRSTFVELMGPLFELKLKISEEPLLARTKQRRIWSYFEKYFSIDENTLNDETICIINN